MIGSIYRVFHIETGMSYIGKTQNSVQKRVRQHFYGASGATRIVNAINKHGTDQFDND